MSTRLRVALIGLGRMGQLYARALTSQVEGVQLYAIADSNEGPRAALAAEYGVPHAFADARDAFARPDLDAVVIATPTGTHPDLVIAAAEAGKPIYCEKPLALTLAETHAALDAVEQAGVPLQIGFNRRFDRGYRRAKEMIEAGQIGRPVTVKSTSRDPFCPRVEFADPKLSGGLIIDMGIHDFDIARWLMGSEVERVSAEGTLMVCDTLKAVGDIDNAVINLRFENGGLGNVELSRHAFYGYDIRTEVLGSEGALNIGFYQHTPVLLLSRTGAQHDVVPYLMERFGDAYRAEIQHFIQCIREDKAPDVGGVDSLRALEIGVAATQSVQAGRPVTLAEVRA